MILRISKIVCLLLLAFATYSQQNKVDSLSRLLQSNVLDTVRVNRLLNLAALNEVKDTDTSLVLCQEALRIAESLQYEEGMAKAESAIAERYYEKSEYDMGNEFALKSIVRWENLIMQKHGGKDYSAHLQRNLIDANRTLCMIILSLGETKRPLEIAQSNLKDAENIDYSKGISQMENVIGTIYYYQGEYPAALEHLFRAVQVCDKMKDWKNKAQTLNAIGSVYCDQQQPAKGLEYYQQSLEIGNMLNDKVRIAIQLGQIGTAYFDMKEFQKSLDYQLKALQTSKELNDVEGQVFAIAGIANSYYELNEPNKVIEYYDLAARLQEEIGDRRGLAITLFNKGIFYRAEADYPKAEKYLLQSLEISNAIEYFEHAMYIHYNLQDIYRSMGRYQESLEQYDAFVAVKDKLFGMEKDKAITEKELQFEFEKKRALAQAEQDKKDLEVTNKLQREKLIRIASISGLGVMIIFSLIVYRQKKKIAIERDRSDELLLNILPSETAEELKATGVAQTKSFSLVTVLFTDFKNFTRTSEILTPEELVAEINHCYSEFDKIITKYGIEKIKTIGDSYMCAGGLPVENATHAEDTVRAALEIQAFMLDYKKERDKVQSHCFELRLGIHTGPVVAGIVGIKKFAYDIWGDTVNIASRMESSGEVGKVNISQSTFELVCDKYHCTHRGKIDAKNKGQFDMYFVDGPVG